jgi:predicted MFS family arabinose efflux permease
MVRSLNSRRAWLPVAVVLLGTGWGSNQFTPMLLVYHQGLGLSTGTLEAMFGVYAVGLAPGLLVGGPLSDRRGRRPVVIPAAALSLAASVALLAAGHAVALLFLGRLLAGISSGAVFAAGTAWLRENSSDRAAPGRAVVSMTAGFALGPLVSGLLAQWAPLPRVTPYLPHVALMAVALPALYRVPETVAGRGAGKRSWAALREARFRRVIVPLAPWVFAAPAIAFAFLPSVVGAGEAADGIALTAAITALCALAGVLIQPVARRLTGSAGAIGLVVLAGGLALGAVAAQTRSIWLLLPCAIVLGCAYGLGLVAGLAEVQRIADPAAAGALTAVFYALCYLGFAAPFVLTLGAGLAPYPTLLSIGAALALGTALVITRATRPVPMLPLARRGDRGCEPPPRGSRAPTPRALNSR